MDKVKKFSLESQGVPNEIYVKFLELAYNTVKEGVCKSLQDFRKDPEQFDFRSAKAIWMNSHIKKLFYKNALFDGVLMKKVNRLKSHGVDYYSLDGKVLICFKKMDKKSRINGFYSKRFKDLMNGSVVHYSKQMLDILTEMQIHKPLPVYYVGQVLDEKGDLSDIRLVHYSDGIVAYEISLSSVFKPNLFNHEGLNKTEDVLVIPKRDKNLRGVS